jgi:hypothetical protein
VHQEKPLSAGHNVGGNRVRFQRCVTFKPEAASEQLQLNGLTRLLLRIAC